MAPPRLAAEPELAVAGRDQEAECRRRGKSNQHPPRRRAPLPGVLSAAGDAIRWGLRAPHRNTTTATTMSPTHTLHPRHGATSLSRTAPRSAPFGRRRLLRVR